MTETKQWALRRSPTVPQEVLQGPDGRMVGWVDGYYCVWSPEGQHLTGSILPLVPLQTAPKKALRCWARQSNSTRAWAVQFSQPFSDECIPMIERAPGDKLAEAVREFEPCEGGNLWKALREYDEATK